MDTFLMPPARARGWTNGGEPAAGCKLYTYDAGTSTPKTTYQDAAGLVPHENPITLDAKGEALIYWRGNYRVDLRTPTGASITGYPVDNFQTPVMQDALDTVSDSVDTLSAAVVMKSALAASTGLALAGAVTPISTTGTAQAALSMVYPGSRKTLADVLDKIQAAGTISIACYGDSLTYGQDTSAEGQPSGGLNGSSVLRSRYPYPESLNTSLGYSGVLRTVTNCGYPGDTSADGLTRWASAAATDVAFLMYGTNDGKTRTVSITDYRKNMQKMIEREIGKGAVVILMAPPMANDATTNLNIQPYTSVLRELAQEYDLQFIDATEQLSGVTSQWTDGLHLSSFAYSELGFHLAALFVNRDRARQSICPGAIFYPADYITRGGTLLSDSRAKSGYFLTIASGESITVGGYFDSDVLPVFTSFKSSGAISRLNVLYAGNGSYRGLLINELAHDPAIAIRHGLTANVLRRGYRTMTLTNTGTDNCYLESIEFADLGAVSVTRGLSIKSQALSAIFQSDRQSAILGDWWTAIDYSHKLKAPYRFTAFVRQSGTGGLCVFKNRQSLSTLSDILLVYRVGNDLVIREIVGGVVTDTTTGGVAAFAAGVYTGEIDIEMTDTAVNVYLDGVLKMTKASPSNTSGFPGLMSSVTTSKMVCHGAQIAGHVKGPY